MKYVAAIALTLGLATAAYAQSAAPTCKVQAAEKKLAGAAQKSFLTKCEKDASESCGKAATEKKLVGAAKTSFAKKCVADAVGK